MKGYIKYPILVTLVLMIAIGLVYAPAPVVPIGRTDQTVPFESNPTAETHTGVGTVTDPAKMWDGDILSEGHFKLGSGLGSTGYVELKTFKVPPTSPFDPEWVDIKMNYRVPTATADDLYRIEYTVGTGNPWIALQPDVGGDPDSKFDPAITRPWAQVEEPSGDGDWSWTDIADLRVRVYCTKVSGWDFPARYMYIFELWVSVYPSPLPPSTSTTVSIQPADVSALGYFFIDVYAMDLSFWDPDALVTRGLWGYEVHIMYDTAVLTALEYYSYWPFKTEAISAIDDAVGLVSVSFYTFAGDTEGFIGNTPLFRVYFGEDSLGMSDLTMDFCELKPVALAAVYPTTYDGFVSTRAIMSAITPPASPEDPDLIDPTMPPEQDVYWHEIWPTYCLVYHQTSFEDNGDEKLSVSDQIDVWDDVAGITRWWHVEEVTTTIWFSLDDFGITEAAAEPTEPVYPDPPNPLGDPLGTEWHLIYPTEYYCYRFTITDWADSDGDGKLGVCDYIYADFGPDVGASVGHVYDMSTDIIVSAKPPPVPEFPLGLGLMIAIAPAIPIVYLWRTRKKVVAK